MKKSYKPLIVVIAVILGLFIAGPFYVVNEGEQAVVIQLGRLVRTVENAGLNVKIPFIDEVVRYPKKIMAWDGEAKSMPTFERQFIFVDITARWRISNPKKLYESIQTVEAAYSKLAEIIDSEVRTVVAENYLRESVRNSNILLERGLVAGEVVPVPDPLELGLDMNLEETIDAVGIISPQQSEEVTTDYEPITRGRRQLAEEILARSRRMVPEYGIELIDVVTRQIRYSPELTQSVYARMIKERNQIAQRYRSQGEGQKAIWLGRMDSQRRSILAASYGQAEKIRGEADATATRIYADAYNRDRGFFEFWRAVESYRTTLPKFNKTLSTDMDYFRYLHSPR
ncbi:MAG: protease modulator HflC [Treponema sp.]|jgi:membrane protease subunit HflC|nr:protease modulator HflC [Treponema sp.]